MDLVSRQKEERRQRILEVARRLIGDRGYESVTMRELAEESLVSVPTLYNLFGGKHELLFAAVEAHFTDLLGGEERIGGRSGLQRLVGMAKLMSAQTLASVTYSRNLMSFFGGGGAGGVMLREFVSVQLTQQVLGAIEQMQSKRQLAAWADAQTLAERLASQIIITTFEWSNGHLDDATLEPAMLYGVAVMLLGLVRGKAASEVEALVKGNQKKARVLDADQLHRLSEASAEA
jgi:AcrR family transcriptional regulator